MEAPFDVFEALKRNTLPTGCVIDGSVELDGEDTIQRLPEELTIRGSLILKNCENLEALPRALHITQNLNLTGCTGLRTIMPGVWIEGSTVLDNCTALTELEEIRTYAISCRDCTALIGVHSQNAFHLNFHGCEELRFLPPRLYLRNLNVSGCRRLQRLPDDIRVGFISLADSGLETLTNIDCNYRLKWRGVEIDYETAFCPELITKDDILNEPNAERRRVLLERFGFERFMNSVPAQTIDADADPGGARRLLRFRLSAAEALVCLEVRCPSTQAVYILRVPPQLSSCHAAAAWIAGFDDPAQYAPLVET